MIVLSKQVYRSFTLAASFVIKMLSDFSISPVYCPQHGALLSRYRLCLFYVMICCFTDDRVVIW